MVCIVASQSTNDEIASLFMISQTICLLPFFIADLCILYIAQDFCLESSTNFFTLGDWLYIDGYFKLTLFLVFVMLYVTYKEALQKSLIIIVMGNLMRFFYIFDFGWTVTASFLFWGNGGAFRFCSSPTLGYLFFLLIFSYVIIPINIRIGSLRATNSNNYTAMVAQQPMNIELSIN